MLHRHCFIRGYLGQITTCLGSLSRLRSRHDSHSEAPICIKRFAVSCDHPDEVHGAWNGVMQGIGQQGEGVFYCFFFPFIICTAVSYLEVLCATDFALIVCRSLPKRLPLLRLGVGDWRKVYIWYGRWRWCLSLAKQQKNDNGKGNYTGMGSAYRSDRKLVIEVNPWHKVRPDKGPTVHIKVKRSNNSLRFGYTGKSYEEGCLRTRPSSTLWLVSMIILTWFLYGKELLSGPLAV